MNLMSENYNHQESNGDGLNVPDDQIFEMLMGLKDDVSRLNVSVNQLIRQTDQFTKDLKEIREVSDKAYRLANDTDQKDKGRINLFLLGCIPILASLIPPLLLSHIKFI